MADVLGHTELVITLALMHLGTGAAGDVYSELIGRGEKADLFNIHHALDRLARRQLVTVQSTQRETADGKMRNVRVFELTDLGRQTMARSYRSIDRFSGLRERIAGLVDFEKAAGTAQ